MKKSSSATGNPFGSLLRGLRLSRRLTLDAVARKVGTHKGYCSGIEKGKVNPPSPKMVERFARLYDLDGADLLELALVCKAPLSIRERMLGRIADNRYLRARVVEHETVPPTVVFGEPWPPGKISGAVPRAALSTESGRCEKVVR